MFLISNGDNNLIDYESVILKYIENCPNGISITDIAHQKNFSRNTVAKYVSLLEQKKLIFKKKVGSSKLLFGIRRNNLPSNLILSFYKMLLKGLRNKYPSDERIMKEIGKEGAEEGAELISSLIPPRTLKQLNSLSSQTLTKVHIDLFKKLYTTFDVLQTDVKITIIEEDYKCQRFLLRFTNSIFLDGSDDMIYHLYLVCGVAEALINFIIKSPLVIDIENTHLDRKKEFCYFDLVIQGK